MNTGNLLKLVYKLWSFMGFDLYIDIMNIYWYLESLGRVGENRNRGMLWKLIISHNLYCNLNRDDFWAWNMDLYTCTKISNSSFIRSKKPEDVIIFQNIVSGLKSSRTAFAPYVSKYWNINILIRAQIFDWHIFVLSIQSRKCSVYILHVP